MCDTSSVLYLHTDVGSDHFLSEHSSLRESPAQPSHEAGDKEGAQTPAPAPLTLRESAVSWSTVGLLMSTGPLDGMLGRLRVVTGGYNFFF